MMNEINDEAAAAYFQKIAADDPAGWWRNLSPAERELLSRMAENGFMSRQLLRRTNGDADAAVFLEVDYWWDALSNPEAKATREDFVWVRNRICELLGKLKLKKTAPLPALLADHVANVMIDIPPDKWPEGWTLDTWRERIVCRLDSQMDLFFSSCWRELESRKPLKPRDDEPTPTDIANVGEVMTRMGTRNPSVRAIRNAVKKAGFSMSNAKISAAVKKIAE